jgi:hypothetical protein
LTKTDRNIPEIKAREMRIAVEKVEAERAAVEEEQAKCKYCRPAIADNSKPTLQRE